MKQDRETRLNVRMSPEELEDLKAYAASKHKTLADWVREVLFFQVREDRFEVLEKRLNSIESKIDKAA